VKVVSKLPAADNNTLMAEIAVLLTLGILLIAGDARRRRPRREKV
jgi:hypothetical protein